MATTFQNQNLVGVEKFDEEKFVLWKQHMQFIFQFRESWEMVNKACKRIDVANKATWDKMDNQQ